MLNGVKRDETPSSDIVVLATHIQITFKLTSDFTFGPYCSSGKCQAVCTLNIIYIVFNGRHLRHSVTRLKFRSNM